MAALMDQIKDANSKFTTAFGDGNPQGISQLYTEDCKLMPTGTDVLTGREAVVNVFSSVMKGGAKTLTLESDEVGPLTATGEASSQMVYERGHYTFYKEGGDVFQAGKYVVIWKQVDGQWYLYTDIFNSNA